MAIEKELLDQLLAGRDPNEVQATELLESTTAARPANFFMAPSRRTG